MGAGSDVGIGGERVQGGGVGVKWWEGGKARRGVGCVQHRKVGPDGAAMVWLCRTAGW